MAVFSIGKDWITGTTLLYKEKQDLYNLIHYCCDKSIETVTVNLVDFEDTNTIYNHFVYLQNCKGKELNTRAIHYILSFYVSEFRSDDWLAMAKDCLVKIAMFYFQDYQHIGCLHIDKLEKRGTVDFHFIINPVNIRNMKIYHCSASELENLMEDIALVLGTMYNITLNLVYYRDEDSGCIRRIKKGRFK